MRVNSNTDINSVAPPWLIKSLDKMLSRKLERMYSIPCEGMHFLRNVEYCSLMAQ